MIRVGRSLKYRLHLNSAEDRIDLWLRSILVSNLSLTRIVYGPATDLLVRCVFSYREIKRAVRQKRSECNGRQRIIHIPTWVVFTCFLGRCWPRTKCKIFLLVGTWIFPSVWPRYHKWTIKCGNTSNEYQYRMHNFQSNYLVSVEMVCQDNPNRGICWQMQKRE